MTSCSALKGKEIEEAAEECEVVRAPRQAGAGVDAGRGKPRP